jgi:adenylate cyclase
LKTFEIEHKWLLNEIPDLEWDTKWFINQGYISKDGYEIRVRSKCQKNGSEFYFLTHKIGIGLKRIENEISVSREIFDFLWPLTINRRLEKIRYIYEDKDSQTWEIDEYKLALKGLFTAELEIMDENQKVIVPEQLMKVIVKEVTGDVKFLNSTLTTI